MTKIRAVLKYSYHGSRLKKSICCFVDV